jgi:hypothetical protein
VIVQVVVVLDSRSAINERILCLRCHHAHAPHTPPALHTMVDYDEKLRLFEQKKANSYTLSTPVWLLCAFSVGDRLKSAEVCAVIVGIIVFCCVVFVAPRSISMDETTPPAPRVGVDPHQAAADELLRSVIVERVAEAAVEGMHADVNDASLSSPKLESNSIDVASARKSSKHDRFEHKLASKKYRTLSSAEMRAMRGSITSVEVQNCVVCRHLAARVLESLIDPIKPDLDQSFTQACAELPAGAHYDDLRISCKFLMEQIHAHMSDGVLAATRRARDSRKPMPATSVVEALALCHDPLKLCRRRDAAPSLRFATADDFSDVVSRRVAARQSDASGNASQQGVDADEPLTKAESEAGVAHFDGRVASIYALNELLRDDIENARALFDEEREIELEQQQEAAAGARAGAAEGDRDDSARAQPAAIASTPLLLHYVWLKSTLSAFTEAHYACVRAAIQVGVGRFEVLTDRSLA